ncbi:MAG TPA: hypothetical protein VGE30_02080 [Candidatus Saccharimonadales bacterium]
MRLLNQTGDTIVEVLIAITVVAAVLGGSYTVVNRTMANSRQAQEHAEALQIANQQIELLTTLVADSGGSGDLYDGNPRYNCINEAARTFVPQHSLRAPSEGAGNYAAACRMTGPVGYRIAIECINGSNPCATAAAGNKHFKVHVTWDSVTGDGNDQASLVYRPYQP